jgi:hypothetical protein
LSRIHWWCFSFVTLKLFITVIVEFVFVGLQLRPQIQRQNILSGSVCCQTDGVGIDRRHGLVGGQRPATRGLPPVPRRYRDGPVEPGPLDRRGVVRRNVERVGRRDPGRRDRRRLLPQRRRRQRRGRNVEIGGQSRHVCYPGRAPVVDPRGQGAQRPAPHHRRCVSLHVDVPVQQFHNPGDDVLDVGIGLAPFRERRGNSHRRRSSRRDFAGLLQGPALRSPHAFPRQRSLLHLTPLEVLTRFGRVYVEQPPRELDVVAVQRLSDVFVRQETVDSCRPGQDRLGRTPHFALTRLGRHRRRDEDVVGGGSAVSQVGLLLRVRLTSRARRNE